MTKILHTFFTLTDRKTVTVYLFQCVNLNVLWCHEEDCGHRACIHLGYRYSEDEHPGKHTGQRVDDSQDRVTQ